MLQDPLPSELALRAGVYTRISSDPSGQRAGVERQQADCEAYCLARGWRVAELFEDNDASAATGKPRRAYERMLAAVEAGASTPSSPGTTTGCTAPQRNSRPLSTWWSARGST